MAEPTEVRIGEHDYRIMRFPARRAARLQASLMNRYLGPAMQAVSDRNIGAADQVFAGLAAMLARTLQTLDEKEFDRLLDDVVDREFVFIKRNGVLEKLDLRLFDTVDQGFDPSDLYMLVVEVIRVNFSKSWKLLADRFGLGTALRDTLRELSGPISKPS